MSYLLDTNSISEARRPAGAASVKSWFASVDTNELYLSVIVIGEIRRGIERLRRRDQVQARTYERWLSRLLRDYTGRILPITAEIADQWGQLKVPDPIPTADGLLAATAIVHRLTMVTRNVADFARTGVAVLDPFDPGR